jgi:hypothetical protein
VLFAPVTLIFAAVERMLRVLYGLSPEARWGNQPELH